MSHINIHMIYYLCVINNSVVLTFRWQSVSTRFANIGKFQQVIPSKVENLHVRIWGPDAIEVQDLHQARAYLRYINIDINNIFI